MTRIADCLFYILEKEGGYSNNPSDKGGATNHGITQRVYNKYLTDCQLPLRSVEEIDMHEVSNIYQKEYWDKCKCSNIPIPLDIVVLDAAVQHGTSRASKWLQQCVGEVVDGIIGDKTLYALHTYVVAKRLQEIINKYLSLRTSFYSQIIKNDPTQKVFEKGWKNRMDSLVAYIKQE
jgi:lysozyme family protein